MNTSVNRDIMKYFSIPFLPLSKPLKNVLATTFFRDSFWSVFGNGFGNFLLLVGGILIARILGKELYGEYGVVKTTMFYIGGFASFGLEYTATKFIAEIKSRGALGLTGICKASLLITSVFSLILWSLLSFFADELAIFVNAPSLSSPFRYLGAILFFRAICSTTKGLLGGFMEFKSLGINSILSGLFFLLCSPLLTYCWGIIGSFIALLVTQIINSGLNLYKLYYLYKRIPKSNSSYTVNLLMFSFPVAMQELIFSICNWGSLLVLTKYASLGDVGIYSAASQWYAVTLFIPNMLANVVLSYLSSNTKDSHKYMNVLNKMILINFICSAIPFIIVLLLSPIIVSFYGNDFDGLQLVLIILIFGTIFACIANVFQADYIAQNRNWLLFAFRTLRDGLILIALFISLTIDNSNAAFKFSMINTVVYFFYFLTMYLGNKVLKDV